MSLGLGERYRNSTLGLFYDEDEFSYPIPLLIGWLEFMENQLL